MATPPAPFDRNAALRDFNQYFGTLQKQYGSAGLRDMGFMPRDLAALQASLRKLQMDPNATPEQHRQAYQQARDTLAQRITTPQPTMQTGAPVAAPMAAQPTAEQLAQHAKMLKSDPNITSSRWDPTVGLYQYTVAPERPMPTPVPTPVSPPPPPVPLYVDPQGPISVAPGGSANFNEVTGNYTRPGGPLDALKNFMPPAGAAPTSAPGGIAGLLGATTPPANPPAQAPVFDRNSALQQLNASFKNLYDTYGADALRGAGFMPRDLSTLQAGLRKLQFDNSSTQEQHTTALQNALNTINSYTNKLVPLASAQAPGSSLAALDAKYSTPARPLATPIPMIGDGALRPTAEQEAAYRAALARGETGAWLPEGGTFLMNNAPMPQSMPQTVAAPTPMPQPVRTPLPNG